MANNSNVNKVVFGNDVLIDLTADTATEDKVMTGYTFHKKDGSAATGSMPNPTSQTKQVTPSLSQQSVSPDQGVDYLSRVDILAIPMSESDNDSGGKTVTIG